MKPKRPESDDVTEGKQDFDVQTGRVDKQVLDELDGKPAAAAADDPLTAPLEKGWDALVRGDFAIAEEAAEEVLELDEESPEGYTLLGAIASSRGDVDEALEHYDHASELAPDYFDAHMLAAELMLDAFDEGLDDALERVELAMDAAEEEEEILDAMLLKAEILVAMGDSDDDARDVLAELPPIDFPTAAHHVRAARIYLDLDDLDAAERHYGKASAQEPALADAHHGLGMVAELRDDAGARSKAWRRVRELDLAEARPAWAMSEDEFGKVADQALEELPDRARELLANVPILASDYPDQGLIDDGVDPRLLGLFAGTPHGEKSSVGGVPHLDRILLFQRNIERIARTPEEYREEIRKTLLHETAHFFGMSEEDLEAIGLD